MAEIVIYQAPSKPQALPKPPYKAFLRGISHGLIVLALLGLTLTLWPLLKSEIAYRKIRKLQPTKAVITFGNLLKKETPKTAIIAPDIYFSLVIPKINARAKIIANVDASNPSEYRKALTKGVAHAKGTVFPGMKGTVYLFAHSTDAPWNIRRYNAVFYLLKELEPGDEIVIFFYGLRYNYRVTEKKVTDTKEAGFFNQKEEELLVLQTCYPPGTTQKALLIYAKR